MEQYTQHASYKGGMEDLSPLICRGVEIINIFSGGLLLGKLIHTHLKSGKHWMKMLMAVSQWDS